MKRRLFVATTISSALAACGPIGTALNNNSGFHNLLGSTQGLNHAVIGTRGLAKEYSERDISATFPIDSLPTPTDSRYVDLVRNGFRDYKLVVDGAVQRRGVFPLRCSNDYAIAPRLRGTTASKAGVWSRSGAAFA